MHGRASCTLLIVLNLVCVTFVSAQGQVKQWRLAERPSVSIGALDGDENYTFGEIETVLRTADGRIVVKEWTSVVRIFDRQGRFVSKFGRDGGGPGEFRVLRTLLPYRGDSLAAADLGLKRISIFDSRGNFARAVQNPVVLVRVPGTIPAQSCCLVSGTLPDGSFIVEPPELLPNTPGGHRNGKLMLLRLAADGARIDTITTVAGTQLSYDAQAPNKIRTLHYTSQFSYAVIGDRLYGGNGQQNALQVFDTRGQAQKPVTLQQPRVPMTRQIRQAAEDSIRAAYARNPKRYEGSVESYLVGEYPDVLPYYWHVRADEVGNLWVASARNPLVGRRAEYRIYSTAGAWLGYIEFPYGAQPMWFGRNEVIVVQADDMGVQRVLVYPLIR